MLAERFPVPVEGADANGVSLGFVFLVAALVLFGWGPATFLYVTALTAVAVTRRNPFIRTIFNAGVFGLIGTLAGLVLNQIDGSTGAAVVGGQVAHPAGDRVLSQVAARLRQGGEAFRLGGDEFAVLLPGLEDARALPTAEAIVARIGASDIGPVGSITISAGIATYPQHGRERDALIRLADSALYWAKEHGKNQVRLARPDVAELSEFRKVASGVDRVARFRAAASLARAVDSRDAYTGSHSERVATLSSQIAEQLGLPGDEIEPTRLPGSLHDLGKLGIPEETLRKPAAPTAAERIVPERPPRGGPRSPGSPGV